jgi:hypothetical protein
MWDFSIASKSLRSFTFLSFLTSHLSPLNWFGLFRFRSPLLTESRFDFSSCGYLDVSVPHVSLLYAMYSRTGTQVLGLSGFPHSDTHGSMAICASPWLFAAYRVLHRLLVPRHSPYALNSLTFDLYDPYWFS